MPDAISPADLVGLEVRVHYNLHRCPGGPRADARPGETCFVVSTKHGGKWTVAGYVSSLLLADAVFKVSEAGIRSIRAKGQRAVIAWIIGTVVNPSTPAMKRKVGKFDEWDGVSFNPFKAWTFYLDDGSVIEKAPLVYLSGRRAAAKLHVANPPGRGAPIATEADLELLAELVGGDLGW